VNQDPYGKGWMILVTPAKPEEWNDLLSAAQYEAFLAEAAH
jgi:glycine cleavage system H protein